MTLKKIIVRSLSPANFSRRKTDDDIRIALYDISGQVDNDEKPSLQICLTIFMYEGVLSSDLSKRILLGDTDYIDGRLRQMEMTMNAKIQEIEAKTQNMTHTIHVLEQKVQEAENHIAFYATLSAHTTLGQKQTIEFDQIITNIGNGYNSVTGVFTVPTTGIYLFSTTMFKFTSTENEIHTQLMQNNNVVGQNFGNFNRASGTQNVIVSAQKGDSVYVRHHEALGTTPQAIHGNGYSSFSGFLIS